MGSSDADLIAAARSMGQAARRSRYAGKVRIGGLIYSAAVTTGRAGELIDETGRIATQTLTAEIGCDQLADSPTPGGRIFDVATGQGYEIMTVRRSGQAWVIRAAIFPR